MVKASLLALLLFTVAVVPARGQAPAGALAGIVTDQTGAALPGASVTIVGRQSRQTRTIQTSAEGNYSAPILSPDLYQVTVEAIGFQKVIREAVVEVGTTTTLDLRLDLGQVAELVTVDAVTPLIRRDHHQVGGLVTRDQIERLPLNGRTFLELAKLEPGVTNPARLADGRVFVSTLGGGVQTIPRVGTTRVTVDGAAIGTPGTVGVLLQVSQDLVQEFQISTVNFEQTSSLTSNGSINIVTRSGGNAHHGSGFYFNRDDALAAYPALRRDPANPHPSFERHQVGASLGGRLRKDRAFFFGNFEGTDQLSVVTVQPLDEFAGLGGIFPSPYDATQFSARVDVHVNRNHTAFARYTRDRNSTFANTGPSLLPSSWSRRVNDTDQAITALTSVLSPALVNDVRLSYFTASTPVTAATEEDCPNCFGLGAPRVTVSDVGIIFGGDTRTSLTGRRYQLTDNVVWQKGTHNVRFGFDWEHGGSTQGVENPATAQITLFSPRAVRLQAPSIRLPSEFTSPEQILQLPLRRFDMSVGSSGVLWSGFRKERRLDMLRLYVTDTWRARPRLTLNYGLGWSYEPNAFSHDLTKPLLLAPILGIDGLQPAPPAKTNFSPTVGFTWMATRDGKTVVRGGTGRYFDPEGSTNALNLTNERQVLSPLGTGRLTQTSANLRYQGQALEFQQPTAFTGAQLLAILPSLFADLQRLINPDNRDLSVRNLDRTKQGENFYDPFYSTPYAIHASLGVQRELGAGVVVRADVAWKRFVHTFINGIDYNHWNSARGSAIPKCPEEQRNDIAAACSNGPMYFDTTIGRARYLGLLTRLEKRFARGSQFVVSYALGSFDGTNGTGTGTTEAPAGRVFGFNNDNWFENVGPLPTDQRHVLNVSGFMDLPLRLQLAVNVSAYSATPFAPYVSNADFNGDGTINDLLPGTSINQFGRGLGKDDLERLVDAYNQNIARKPTPSGRLAPPVALPATYSFNDSFFTQDVRVSRTFGPPARSLRVTTFVEVFNLFNTPNLMGFGSNLSEPSSFGQPASRYSQVFGSGGPRAFQLGARVSF